MPITRSLTIAAVAALLAIPSAAVAVGPPPNPGGDHRPAGTPAPAAAPSKNQPTGTSTAGVADQAPETPGPDAPAGEKAKAYGKHCQGQSKQHIAGQKGTAFSKCVTAMAKVATGKEETSPRAACAPLRHKHKAGTNGTPFSRCVAEARELADQPAGA